MELSFEKWHGCRNDFIIFWSDLDEVALKSLIRQTPRLCSRNGDGIGSDGIIVMHINSIRDPQSHHVTIINSDGSLAATCGNGLRCAAASTLRRLQTLTPQPEIADSLVLTVGHHAVSCRFLGRGKLVNAKNPFVAVTMGHPDAVKSATLEQAARTAVNAVREQQGIKQPFNSVQAFNIQNNHIVVNSDNVSRELLHKIGPALQSNDAWDGINVHLVAAKDITDEDLSRSTQILGSPIAELYEAYVWERGAGETQACGSGACAIGSLALASGFVPRSSWVGIDMPGGRLYVKQDSAEDPVVLAGPTEFVFKGTVEI